MGANGDGSALEEWHEEYAPFVRRDRYGPMGVRVTWWDVTRITLFWLTGIPVLRMVISFYALVSFYLVCSLAQYLPQSTRNRILPWLAYIHVRTLLFCFGFYWIRKRTVEGGVQRTTPRPAAALVSNHDIPVHMSMFFPSFVAKANTRTTPFIGIISFLMDCIYVDRERAEGTGTSGAAAIVQKRLLRAAAALAGNPEEGGYHDRPVLLFPEGTTTNGRYLLPFRTGAFIAGVPVQPVLLKYDWQRFSPAWECIAAGRHIFFILSHLSQSLEVVFLPVYVPSDEEKKDPALYASNVRRIMAQAGGFELTHHTLQHKRTYQAMLLGTDKGTSENGTVATADADAAAAAGATPGASGNVAGGGSTAARFPPKDGSVPGGAGGAASSSGVSR